MKKGLRIIIIVFGLSGFVGCQSDSKNTSRIMSDSLGLESADAPKGIQYMQQSIVKDTVTWKGNLYQYEIKRVPDEELPVVKDEQGVIFADNRIELVILRDEKEFFKWTFTKKTFAAQLDEDFEANGILEGLVFDKVVPGGLQFAASVCYPQSDLFMPLLIVVSGGNRIRIQKDTILDTEGSLVDE